MKDAYLPTRAAYTSIFIGGCTPRGGIVNLLTERPIERCVSPKVSPLIYSTQKYNTPINKLQRDHRNKISKTRPIFPNEIFSDK